MKWLSKLFGEHANVSKIDGDKLFLFWDGTKHYHAWLVNGKEQYVWPMVKEALQKDDGRRTDLILTNGNVYTFLEEDKLSFNHDSWTKAIELFYNKNIAGSFTLRLGDEDYDLSFIDFIKEGEWQKDIIDFLAWKKGNDKLMERNIDELMERNRREKMNKTLDA